MLLRLDVKNFAVIESISCDFSKGLSTFTGETGAGKSLLLDALSQVIGNRAEPGLIRKGHDHAEITAEFLISDHPNIIAWLDENGFNDNEPNLLTVKKVIYDSKPSKSSVNGHACSLSELKRFGRELLNIHGQGSNEKLRDLDFQHDLFDLCINAQQELEQTSSCFVAMTAIRDRINQIVKLKGFDEKERDFLRFQLNEMKHLNLKQEYIDALQAQHKSLHHLDSIQKSLGNALELLEGSEINAQDLINKSLSELQHVEVIDIFYKEQGSRLESISLELEDISSALQHHLGKLDLSPEKLDQVENEIQTLHNVARKHHTDINGLEKVYCELNDQLNLIEAADDDLLSLQKDLADAEKKFMDQAKRLSSYRKKNTAQFEELIKRQLKSLGFKFIEFKVLIENLNESNFNQKGIESVRFYISANPGMSLGPLEEIASGGEMSRICLALEMMELDSSASGTVIFDEVDTGVGGAVAETIGKLLRKLSKTHQVFCITHLPQVASQAHYHFQIEKNQTSKTTTTQLKLLNKIERINEIARMLGGSKITEAMKKNASEMLAI